MTSTTKVSLSKAVAELLNEQYPVLFIDKFLFKVHVGVSLETLGSIVNLEADDTL
jgi:hypothetical protein